MNAVPIVENLDEHEEFALNFFHCIIRLVRDAFAFCGGEKALHARIVVRTSGLTHAALVPMLFQILVETDTSVLSEDH
jgi:hypothetical protein